MTIIILETNLRSWLECIVVKAFEEYDKGMHTLDTIADFLADHGLSTKGTPPAKASVARMLSNRVYLGFTYHKGEYYDGSFAPIISPTLYEAVQKCLRKNHVFACKKCQIIFHLHNLLGVVSAKV